MNLIEPFFEVVDFPERESMYKRIETAGRTCYKSTATEDLESTARFIRNLVKRRHESVIEHEKITVKIVCDRGVSHEIVRHRIASYSQESTRYCNYTKDKFNNEITFIKPYFWADSSGEQKQKYEIWKEAMRFSEKSYFELLKLGAKPEEARSVLPNSLKTEIVVTMNLRAWRHFFMLRASKKAHPQIRQIAGAMLNEFQKRLPELFDDIAC